MDTYRTNQTPLMPCDRGIPGGPRGYHEFQSMPGGVPTCRYCGETGRRGWA